MIFLFLTQVAVVIKIAKQLISAIQNITPDYNINFAWKTIKLKNCITPMLKPKTDKLQKSGLVYGYECPCGAKYVGETKRKLEVRIQDHNQKCRNTAVYSHIKTCQSFSDLYSETYGEPPKFDPKKRDLKESRNRFNILKNRFSIIGSNLENYYRRTDYEGIYITLNKPVLNEQVKYRNVKLI